MNNTRIGTRVEKEVEIYATSMCMLCHNFCCIFFCYLPPN
jgi:hypothetical protein